MLLRALIATLAIFYAGSAQAYLVTVNFSGSVLFSGGMGGGNVTTSMTYETVSATVTDLSVNIGNSIGNPPVTISGPLTIGASSIVINGTGTTDFYDFYIDIVGGPFLYLTQSNGFQRSAQLTQVWFNSGQNTDPIPDDTLDENLFPAFVPRSGVQPQRMFLTFTPTPLKELSTSGTVTHNPTSVSVSEVPLPPTLALIAGGIAAAGAFLRYRHTEGKGHRAG